MFDRLLWRLLWRWRLLWLRRLLAPLSLLLAACPTTLPVPVPAAGFPTRTCKDAWAAGLPAGGGDYDFRRDSKSTPDGNLGYEGYAARVDRRHCHKEWTVLLYMEANNDLSPYAYLNLYEMEAAFPDGKKGAASTVDTDVLVGLAAPGQPGLRRLHMFQSDEPYDATLTRAHFAQKTPASLRSPVVRVEPEQEPFNEAADLKNFLTWGASEYPANHTLVVVWGHGEGWGLPQTDRPPQQTDPGAAANPFDRFTGGIAFDWTRRTYLGVPTLHQVLREVVDGPLFGKPIDVYLSDACLMQSMEVATELSDVARFVSGSIQVEDYLGMSYRGLLPRLNLPGPQGMCAGQPDEAACTVAGLIPEVYETSLDEGLRAGISPTARTRFTLSSVRSATLRGELLPAMTRLGGALLAYLQADPRHRGELLGVLNDRESPSFLGNSRDIGVFLGLLEDRLRRHSGSSGAQPAAQAAAQLQQAITLAREALRHTEVRYTYGSDYSTSPGFAALSVWLPLSADDYHARATTYAPSAFFQQGRPRNGGAEVNVNALGPWQAWLDHLYEPAKYIR